MQVRVLFSIVNIGIFLALFALEFVFTRYATLLFYVLLGWFVASFLLFRLPFMSRRIGAPVARPAPEAPGTPLPSSAGLPPPLVDGTEIGFCPHCGTNIAPGTLVCPSCGKSTRIG
jgi:zinc ribbon protein